MQSLDIAYRFTLDEKGMETGLEAGSCLPMLALPNKRLDFVEEEGGGGFWIWEAVGARDWRMEYVLCILELRWSNALEDSG